MRRMTGEEKETYFYRGHVRFQLLILRVKVSALWDNLIVMRNRVSSWWHEAVCKIERHGAILFSGASFDGVYWGCNRSG